MLKDNRFQGYSARHLQKDIIAGLVVGVVAIPLAMAFAIASGVRPEYGIYTTIIAGIVVSILGGSKFQIAGPTGAFVPVLLGVVMQFGYENLIIAGFMAGIMVTLLGIFKLGKFIKFIPRPVTIGFTAGIAIIIFSGQIANFLGLKEIAKHEEFHLNMIEILRKIGTINIYSVIVAAICLAIVITTPKFLPKIPGALLGLLVSTLVAITLFPGKVATIGSTYGAIPSKLPSFSFPDLSWDNIVMLFPAACVIAMLGGIESLLSAVVADNMAKTKHNSNKELVGQGIANIATSLFGGIPATGAIARTATNIKNGAASPLSGVIHGLVVLLVLVMLAPYASNIPLASMAPILMFVAWNMSERKEFAHILKTKSADSFVLVATFLLTVSIDLTTGVGVGLLLAIVMFVKRMSGSLKISKVLAETSENAHKNELMEYTMQGSLFFGSAEVLEDSFDNIAEAKPKVLLLRMSQVSFIDTSGEALLSKVVERLKDSHSQVVISGLQHQPKEMLKSTGLYDKIGEKNIFSSEPPVSKIKARHRIVTT
ncbi:SulP family inorganic anion transporter [Priestia megaterium]|uniref:SulP family inorganic anion transporter n=1 Tax=Priestia megaterium TaxID=1404 RepID=UPI002E1BCA69|nr:solute carrier family 23 protein [Priestia megaterium]MED3981785.1 SulP family inorganic anion transporter [Priestia megaterium]